MLPFIEIIPELIYKYNYSAKIFNLEMWATSCDITKERDKKFSKEQSHQSDCCILKASNQNAAFYKMQHSDW